MPFNFFKRKPRIEPEPESAYQSSDAGAFNVGDEVIAAGTAQAGALAIGDARRRPFQPGKAPLIPDGTQGLVKGVGTNTLFVEVNGQLLQFSRTDWFNPKDPGFRQWGRNASWLESPPKVLETVKGIAKATLAQAVLTEGKPNSKLKAYLQNRQTSPVAVGHVEDNRWYYEFTPNLTGLRYESKHGEHTLGVLLFTDALLDDTDDASFGLSDGTPTIFLNLAPLPTTPAGWQTRVQQLLRMVEHEVTHYTQWLIGGGLSKGEGKPTVHHEQPDEFWPVLTEEVNQFQTEYSSVDDPVLLRELARKWTERPRFQHSDETNQRKFTTEFLRRVTSSSIVVQPDTWPAAKQDFSGSVVSEKGRIIFYGYVDEEGKRHVELTSSKLYDPADRNKGYGKELYLKLLEWADANDAWTASDTFVSDSASKVWLGLSRNPSISTRVREPRREMQRNEKGYEDEDIMLDETQAPHLYKEYRRYAQLSKGLHVYIKPDKWHDGYIMFQLLDEYEDSIGSILTYGETDGKKRSLTVKEAEVDNPGRGYGKVLYNAVLDFAEKHDAWVRSDDHAVSDLASGMWRSFYRNPGLSRRLRTDMYTEPKAQEPSELAKDVMFPAIDRNIADDLDYEDQALTPADSRHLFYEYRRAQLDESFTTVTLEGEERKQYLQQVWDMYIKTYSKIGTQYDRPEQLLSENLIWRLRLDAEGDPRAFRAFKRTNWGFKLVLAGTDGSPEAKRDFITSYVDTMSQPGYYAEVSHAVDALAQKHGIPGVPVSEASKILGKDLTPEDEFYYTRAITGLPEPVRKRMIGLPQWQEKSTQVNGQKKIGTTGIVTIQRRSTMKTARLVQRDGKWALVSKKDPHKVLKWFGKIKPSEAEVLKEERRVQYFKRQGSVNWKPSTRPGTTTLTVPASNLEQSLNEHLPSYADSRYIGEAPTIEPPFVSPHVAGGLTVIDGYHRLSWLFGNKIDPIQIAVRPEELDEVKQILRIKTAGRLQAPPAMLQQALAELEKVRTEWKGLDTINELEFNIKATKEEIADKQAEVQELKEARNDASLGPDIVREDGWDDPFLRLIGVSWKDYIDNMVSYVPDDVRATEFTQDNFPLDWTYTYKERSDKTHFNSFKEFKDEVNDEWKTSSKASSYDFNVAEIDQLLQSKTDNIAALQKELLETQTQLENAPNYKSVKIDVNLSGTPYEQYAANLPPKISLVFFNFRDENGASGYWSVGKNEIEVYRPQSSGADQVIEHELVHAMQSFLRKGQTLKLKRDEGRDQYVEPAGHPVKRPRGWTSEDPHAGRSIEFWPRLSEEISEYKSDNRGLTPDQWVQRSQTFRSIKQQLPSAYNKLMREFYRGVTAKIKTYKRKSADRLPGGKADDMPDELYDPAALEEGIKHELEHVDPSIVGPEVADEIATEIAKDHLEEQREKHEPQTYYRDLKKIEASETELFHYSRTPGLTELDPDFLGKGSLSRSERNDTRVPHTFFYMKGTEPEVLVKSTSRARYEAKLPPGSKILDIATRPDWLVHAYKYDGAGGMRQAIKDNGYFGYLNSESALPNAVAVFYKLPVTETPMD